MAPIDKAAKFLFLKGNDEDAMRGFLVFSAVVLIAVAVLLILGQFILAIIAAFSATVIEAGINFRKKQQLKVRLGLILTLYGPTVLLLIDLLKLQ